MALVFFALTLAFVLPRSAQAVITSFATGSLIIPMDTGTAGQDNGMLTAYGLVYELLRNEVPVYWVINPAKTANGDDFAIATSNSLQDVRTGATVAPRSYRGGPFVIAASDAASALPIIQAWQAAAGDQTSVHKYIGAASFNGDVSRTLVRAPRIGIIKDGNETIAFNNFNAARLTDSVGNVWSSSSPDLLTEADLAGPTTTSHRDGVLFSSPLVPRYGFIAAMHYNTTTLTEEVIAEVRSWLATSSLLHAYAQCEAMRTFENAAGGLFLTNAGLDDDGNATTNPANRAPSSPLTQLDGTFEVDSGAVDSFAANGGGYKTGVTTLINDNASNLLQRIVMLTGRLDGESQRGQVTYLAGHDYSLDLPITSNPQTNGIRLFLNSIFKSDCATTTGQDVSITKSAPALTNQNEIPYTITLQNPVAATAPAENIVVRDRLPANTTYVVGSGSPAPTSIAGGVLTWFLPSLAPGATTTVTFRVAVTADGNYSNIAKVGFANLTVQSVSSSPAITVRETGSPTPTPAPTPTERQMVNLSARAEVGTGDNVTIAGFIIHSDPSNRSSPSGTAAPTKKVLLRGLGPSLAAYNIAGTLQDPVLDLYDGNGAIIESNDDWATSPGAAEMISRGLAPSDPHESAILRTLNAGVNYTAVLSGKDNTTGVGLVEAYDMESTSTTHLVNISSRAFVDTGDNVLIGGLIVKGDTAADILVRALGPSLASHGIANALADPILELHDANGELLETNDNWMDTPRKDDIIAVGFAPSDEHESAMFVTPVPGNYTGIVRGVSNSTGVALIEMYRFPLVAH